LGGPVGEKLGIAFGRIGNALCNKQRHKILSMMRLTKVQGAASASAEADGS
jgi:hypothetical protein